MQHVSVHVRQNLHLDMARLRQIRLQIHAAVAKGKLGFPAHKRKLPLQRRGILHDADSFAAAAFCRLDHQRIADALCRQRGFLAGVNSSFRAGHDGEPVGNHRLSRGLLVAQHAHACRQRPDEADTRLGACLRKRVVFREKANPGV
ncbi:hypothetical protein SDC9_196975 [bioreactor metagenome]|uniref:Uncharacterized protein n=1 Tax=bioreactor metagenome TaxID=1076179 RepID=A0A645IDH8_9ZZZZ